MALYTSEKFILSEYSDGTSPYTLSLDNDSDVMVINSEGKFIGVTENSAVASVSANLYEGNNLVSGDDFSIKIDEEQANTLFGTNNNTDTNWEFSNNTLKIYNLANKIAQTGTITFLAKKGTETLCEKRFTFKVIVSSVDYDLVVSKRVINNNSGNKTVSVGIIKKDENGTTNLNSFEQNSPIKIKYGTTTVDSGELPISPTISTNTTIQLLSQDGAFTWDEETIEIVENGVDGKSFNNIIEYYKATASKEGKEGEEVPGGVGEGGKPDTSWVNSIAETGHSEDKKYLWNIEGVESKDKDGNKSTVYTTPDMILVWNGRTIKDIYSYYAVSTSSANKPKGAPELRDNGNTLTIPESTEWELNSLSSAPDHATYLWETTITEYNSADVNEKNKYEQIPPHVIGYNGADAYHMELDNDTDVIAIAGGNPIGLPITVTGKIYSGGIQITSGIGTWDVSVPSGWVKDTNYSFDNGVLTLKSLYNNAPSGQFTIKWWMDKDANTNTSPFLSKIFSYSTVESPYDWDLFIDKSTINTSDSSQQSISVQVKKKDSSGTNIYNIEGIPQGSNIAVYKGTEKLTKSALTLLDAATFTIKQLSKDGNIPAGFVWDSENVGAIKNGDKGDPAKDFNITASSYMLSADKNGNIKDDSSITLTAHPINLGTSPTIYWRKDDGNWTTSSSLTYTVDKNNGIGTYSAKVNDTQWIDSVTIGKTLDGQTGKDAIAITLSNPTMTFHSNTTGELETCAVIVYEGSNQLSATATSGARFTVAEKTDSSSKASVSGGIITVSDPGDNNGQATFIVTVYPSTGDKDKTSKEVTIYWKSIKNGTNGHSLQVEYQYADSKDKLIESAWNTSYPTYQNSTLWMRQKMSNQTSWGEATQISAKDGSTPEIEIVDSTDADGNPIKVWKINGEMTSISAEGKEGHTPNLTIDPESGEWLVDGETTNVKAQGPAGADGASTEFVYYLRKTINGTLQPAPTSAPAYNGNGELTSGWTKSPTGITEPNPEEYMSVRTKPQGTDTQWSSFSPPVIWSKWGEKGQDGDGVEYKYYRKNEEEEPTYSPTDPNWKDDPQGTNASNKYEYVAIIKTKHNADGTATTSTKVTLWDKYVTDGASPYSLELSNDSATIGTNASGGGYTSTLLKTVSTVTATLFQGTTPLTQTISWSATGGTLNTTSGSTVWFTALSADTATATASVTVGGKTLTKTFTISKNKQGTKGDNAITYVLAVSPNSWNKTINTNQQVTFTITKYIGDSVGTIGSNEVRVVKNGTTTALGSSTSISSSTSFDLQVNNSGTWTTVDSETVTAVEDGDDSTVPGPAAKDFDITASAYVFAEDSSGNISGSITFTAKPKNLTNPTYSWTTQNGTYSSTSTYTLNASNFGTGTSKIITCYCKENGSYFGSDSITIYRVPKGSTGASGNDAIVIGLTNGNMTFNKTSTTATETTTVIANSGSNAATYSSSTPSANSGWKYTISKTSPKVSINSSTGEITVTNPQEETSIQINITMYYNGAKKNEKIVYINCSLVEDGDNGTSSTAAVEEYPIYCTGSTPLTLPSTPGNQGEPSSLNGWQKTKPSSQTTYVWRSIATKTTTVVKKGETLISTTYSWGAWSAPQVIEALGKSDAQTLATINNFMAVTNGGANKGIYYTKTDGTPVTNLENFDPAKDELHINASMINTGVFEVSNETKDPILSADATNGSVQLGGFFARKDSLISSDEVFLINSDATATQQVELERERSVSFSSDDDSIFYTWDNEVWIDDELKELSFMLEDIIVDNSIEILEAYIRIKTTTGEKSRIEQLERKPIKDLLTITSNNTSNAKTKVLIGAKTTANSEKYDGLEEARLYISIKYKIIITAEINKTYLKIGSLAPHSISFSIPSSADGFFDLSGMSLGLKRYSDENKIATPLNYFSYENAVVEKAEIIYEEENDEGDITQHTEDITEDVSLINGYLISNLQYDKEISEVCVDAKMNITVEYEAYDFSVSKDGKINSPTIEYLMQNTGSGSGDAIIIQQKINFATDDQITAIFG